ncbi:MAG TPA: response regulator transcription factor [Actinomycetota bacterium]|nr:response regulator transcription factor [Actinomycetota bacterium]
MTASSGADLSAGSIRVLIAEDQAMFAEGLVRLIAAEPDLHVVATVDSAAEAVLAARTHEPDVVVMDYRLRGGDGVTATKQIKNERHQTQVVMLTGFADPSVLIAAMDAGCSGFLTKDQALPEVVNTVRRAHAGEAVADPFVLASILPRLRREPGGGGSALTAREREILMQTAQGRTSQDIADQMTLSVHTVRNHLQAVMRKLEAHSRLEAVAKAVRLGLINLG